MKRIIFSLLFLALFIINSAHPYFALHRQDFYAVLGFQENLKIDEWMRFISSDMIDNYKGISRAEYNGLNFYSYIKKEFPGFKCKHRLLFHWGYNSRPWNSSLQRIVDALPLGSNPDEVRRFQQALIREQKIRNGNVNTYTESLFGFGSSGKEAAYANAMISIVYDTHLLGDYTPDNSDLEGLQNFESVVGDLINAIRKIDEVRGKELIKKIQKVSQDRVNDIQQSALCIITLLSSELPHFLQEAQGRSLCKHFMKQGIYFR